VVNGCSGMKRLVVMALLAGAGSSLFAATKDVRRVVAQVGAEWNDDAKLRKLHESLAEKFSDAPAFADMMARMKWVVAVDVFEAKRARTVAARAEGGLEVRKGDIVEVDFRGDPNRAKSFEEMPKVVRVVCKAGSQDFDACKQGAKMGAFDAEDNRTSWSN